MNYLNANYYTNAITQTATNAKIFSSFKQATTIFFIAMTCLGIIPSSYAAATTSASISINTTPDNKLPKPVPQDFTGYSVQLIEVDKELNDKHSLFQNFGDIKVEKVDGMFYYLVGDFTSEAAAQEFIDNVIADRYAGAIVARYENGIRIDLDE